MTMDKVDKLLEGVEPNGPTFFQLTYFVVGQEPTNQARMKRCLEEMKSRRSMMKAATLEIEEINDINELHRLDLTEISWLGDNPPDNPRRTIHDRQLNRKITANDLHIKDLESKVKAWEGEVDFLRKCYEQISAEESLKPWNDHNVQLEYWNAKLTKDIKSKLLLKNGVDVMTLETALSLPNQAPIKQQLEEILKEKNAICR